MFSFTHYDNLSAAVICFLSPLIKYKALTNYQQVLLTTYFYVAISTTKYLPNQWQVIKIMTQQ